MSPKPNIEELMIEIKDEYVRKKYPTKFTSYCLEEHPDDIFIKGKVFVYEKPDGFFNTKPYCSKIFKNPSYGVLFQISDEMYECMNEWQHHFFEGIRIIKQINVDTYQITLCMGS